MVENRRPSLEDFDRRLKRLKGELAGAEKKRVTAEPSSGLGTALAMAIHLVAGIGVGGVCGYFLDGWLGTAPALFILLLFLGAAGGMLNIYRTATRQGLALGYRPAESRPDADRRESEEFGVSRRSDEEQRLGQTPADRQNSERGADRRKNNGDGS